MTSTMKAVQYRRVGSSPEVVDVDIPEPGPGEILLKVDAAGMCHSDLAVMGWPAEQFPYRLPLTLGHEGVGTISAFGPGRHRYSEGDRVAVYGPWGCGLCRMCSYGKENYCRYAGRMGINPPGLGAPGAMAEYLLVDDERHLVPLGDLDPVEAAPLTDAGLTPYHAIKKSLPKLVPGSTAAVIGAGGLGHVGIQLLRALTSAQVVAMDINDQKMELAERVGAHRTIRSDDSAPEAVSELTDGKGAEAVFDFVGNAATTRIASRCVTTEGEIAIVGVGEGTIPVGFGTLPFEAAVSAPYWGTRGELMELLELAGHGSVRVHVDSFPLEETPQVYERFHHGEIAGRAVIVP
ncbi:alcohol dehydrogenase, propanol-preferring [Actinopolyspora saharensis]|uniref:alcohol dehydrogenase n=2 Tax=Actinopolyspora saharensis TaxID=995062 RepID=A0A1H1FKV9_9ACTN|nr:NAD(P)-dependent alcohol dehydrogenase [Actinopolyspora saharensis]SDR01672.1 alcohol dehydrogenase, propanol-preferring [Actinopolyspora saharensis]